MRVLFASFAILSASLHNARAQILSIQAPPPARDFGYFPGDILSRSVRVGVAPGTVLDARSLPQPGPVSAWLDLRSVSLHGKELNLDYQIFLSPEQVTQAEAPGFTVTFSKDGRELPARVPGFTVTVAPFRHDLQPVIDPLAMRPDHPPRADGNSGNIVILAVSSACALASLAVLTGGGLIRRGAGPFAQASHAIRRHKADTAAHLLALHRAFDSTAGARVLGGDIESFLAKHKNFQPLRSEIGTFFAASNAAFFAESPLEPIDLCRLSRALAQAERRA